MRAIEHVIFSGGGTRCFWHGGFLSVVGDIDTLAPSQLTAISGGALSAACWISGRDERCREVMRDHFKRNESNIELGKSNATPHQELYRSVVETTLEEQGCRAVAEGPRFDILVSVTPLRTAMRAQAAFYGALCQSDQRVRSTPHIAWPRRFGLKCRTIDARQAARDGRLFDLICAAATIPPVFDIPEWKGAPVLDAGLYTKAPPPGDDRRLYLLTKPYANCPEDTDKAAYVGPSSEVEADKIDFTDPAKIAQTWDQGVRDAKDWISDRPGVAKS